MELSLCLNNLLFLSFHITQAQDSQISCMNERLTLPPPVMYINCTKWSEILLQSTPTNPIHSRTCYHNDANTVHERKRCSAVSTLPQPETHKKSSAAIMPRIARLAFVGKRSRMSLQANIVTFNGTCLCHTNSKALSIWEVSQLSNKS